MGDAAASGAPAGLPAWTVGLSAFGATRAVVTTTPAAKAAARAKSDLTGALIGTLLVSGRDGRIGDDDINPALSVWVPARGQSGRADRSRTDAVSRPDDGAASQPAPHDHADRSQALSALSEWRIRSAATAAAPDRVGGFLLQDPSEAELVLADLLF